MEINIDNDNNDQLQNVTIKSEKDLLAASSTSSVVDEQLISEKPKKGNKKRKDLADLSIQRLNKTAKNTKVKVKTRSQKQIEEEDAEESN